MKACISLIVLLCAYAVFATAQQSQQPKKATGEEGSIIALESAWDQAEQNKDVNALANLLADDLVYVDYDGSISTKQALLADVKSADVTGEQINNEGVTVHMHGNNVAVSTGIYRDKGMEHDLGFRSHVHSAACSGGTRVRGNGWRGSGMALGRGTPCWRRGAHFARNQSERASRGKYQPGAIQQLGFEFRRRCACSVAVVAGQHTSCRDNGDCHRVAGALRVLALSTFPLRSARDAETTDRVNRALFQVEREPIEKRFVPELRVLRLKHPVAFVGEDDEL